MGVAVTASPNGLNQRSRSVGAEVFVSVVDPWNARCSERPNVGQTSAVGRLVPAAGPSVPEALVAPLPTTKSARTMNTTARRFNGWWPPGTREQCKPNDSRYREGGKPHGEGSDRERPTQVEGDDPRSQPGAPRARAHGVARGNEEIEGDHR